MLCKFGVRPRTHDAHSPPDIRQSLLAYVKHDQQINSKRRDAAPIPVSHVCWNAVSKHMKITAAFRGISRASLSYIAPSLVKLLHESYCAALNSQRSATGTSTIGPRIPRDIVVGQLSQDTFKTLDCSSAFRVSQLLVSSHGHIRAILFRT
jgi:hypothetical protein